MHNEIGPFELCNLVQGGNQWTQPRCPQKRRFIVAPCDPRGAIYFNMVGHLLRPALEPISRLHNPCPDIRCLHTVVRGAEQLIDMAPPQPGRSTIDILLANWQLLMSEEPIVLKQAEGV